MIDIPEAPAPETMLAVQPCWRAAELDGKRTAMVSCSNGHVGYLSDHTIADDGKVTPSLVCPEEDCDWHVHARLAGWAP